MKALVTGGAGFIGAHLARHLQAEGFDVKVLDNFLTGGLDNLWGFGGEILRGDVLEIDGLIGSWRPDIFFHQAAITDTTVLDRERQVRVNVEGTRAVLELARGSGAKVVYASSAAIYGAGPAPMVETQKPAPLNPYGESKLMVDQLAGEYAVKYGLVTIGLRYFNVYGPFEQHKGKMASMVWQLAMQIASGKRPRIFKWGEQERDQIYVRDIVQANLLAARSNASGVYNVGTGRSVSFNDIVVALNEVLGSEFEPEYFENPYEFYQNQTLADITKARQVLGFEPAFDLRSGVRDYFEEFDLPAYLAESTGLKVSPQGVSS